MATRYTAGIDPGTRESGLAVIDTESMTPLIAVKISNSEVTATLEKTMTSHGIAPDEIDIAMEAIASYGKPVGRETFETCVWIGRMDEQIAGLIGRYPDKVYRREEKMTLCGTIRARDSDIRSALINLIGPVGTAKNPGPLYGVYRDAWSAIAVAVKKKKKGRMEENHDC